jgi:UDP-glucose 4-epimerase
MQKKRKEKKRIAITGASSFIGSSIQNLAQKSDDFDKIIAFDLIKPYSIPDKVKFYGIDLSDPASGVEMSRILKEENINILAHTVFLWNPVREQEWSREVEVIGTIHVMNACADASVSQIIISSTTAVYGMSHRNPCFFTEEHPLAREESTPGIMNKIEAENEVIKFMQNRSDMKISVLRICHILGKRINNYFTRKLLLPVVPTLLGYDPMMQFIYETDLVRALDIVLHGEFNGVFNIAGQGAIPLSEVLRIGKRKPLPLPHLLAYKLYDVLHTAQIIDVPPGYLNYLRYSFVADGTRSKNVLGFVPFLNTSQAVETFYSERF